MIIISSFDLAVGGGGKTKVIFLKIFSPSQNLQASIDITEDAKVTKEYISETILEHLQ